jgi:hypothetical protein
VNNGDSPRSWASIIRSYGASDKDYGLLYISPNNIVLGVRQENKCYFAYDIKNSKFYGHGKIEEISPFMLIEKDTKLHEPDVLAMLYQVIHTTSFYEKEYSVIIGSLPGCPRLATLQKGLENPNKRVQEISLWCIKIQEGGLSKQDEDIEKLTDYLIEQMSSENPICRMHALKSIGYFKGSCVEKAIPHLEKAIQDEISDIRSSAAYSLGEIGEKAFPALLQCLKSNDASVRFYGLYGFRIAGPKSQSCIKAIIPMLADKEASVRRQALIALETIQYYGDDLIPYLKNLTKDGDKWIKRDAENMLKRIESKKASDTSD